MHFDARGVMGVVMVVLTGCGDDVAGMTEGAGASEGASDTGSANTGSDTEPTGGDVPELGMKLEWSWTTNEVTVVPLVVDLLGDGRPTVIVNASRVDGLDRTVGEIVALDGQTGTELWRVKEAPQQDSFGSFGAGTPVIGDVNGDARADIVYPGRSAESGAKNIGLVHAIDGAGKHLWTAHDAEGQPVALQWQFGAATMSNLDDDAQAEIAVGGVLIDNDGLVVWNPDARAATLGSPTDNKATPKILFSGSLATFVDLTGDGKPELLTGRDAWKISWTPGAPPTVALELLWTNSDGEGNDGWPAVADLDDDGNPEVVLVAWPDIRVLDGKTGKLWCGVDPTGVMCEGNDGLRTRPIAIEGDNLGGPPTIADFDGDGRPEVGIAGGSAYAVYDFHRIGEALPQGVLPAGGSMFVLWSSPTQDNSSAVNGSSVFDFQGDGFAEVLYQDECRLRVYDGRTGKVLYDEVNSSGTVHEYPIVVDVDGDGSSEFLAVANQSEPVVNAQCLETDPAFVTRQGVFSYGAAGSAWAPTRMLWTQHTYHVTHADSLGNVPFTEEPSWTTPGLNNFRQNVQGEAP